VTRSRLFLAAAVAAAVVLVVVVLRAGDEPVRLERGLPERGFPLRGSLAGDGDAIDDAVQAWRENRGDPVEDEEDEERRFDEDDRVAVLWIGRVPDRDVALLEQDGLVAEVRRREDRDDWVVASVVPWERSLDPAPLSYDGGVLLPDGPPHRYVAGTRERSSDDVVTVDGLVTGEGRFGGDLPPGFVYPAEARTDGGATVVLARGLGLRRVPADEYDAFLARMGDGTVVALWHAFRAAAPEDEEGRPLRSSGLPPEVSVLWSGSLPGRPTVLVVDEEGRGLGLGADDPAAEDDDVVQSVPLGAGTDPSVSGARRRAAVGFGEVRTADGPRLVVAGVGVDRLELLAGRNRRTGPGPVLTLPAPWLGDAAREQPRDVVAFGRTADGAVVAPLARRRP